MVATKSTKFTIKELPALIFHENVRDRMEFETFTTWNS